MIAMRNRNKMERLSGNSSSTTIAKLSIDVTTTMLFFFKAFFDLFLGEHNDNLQTRLSNKKMVVQLSMILALKSRLAELG